MDTKNIIIALALIALAAAFARYKQKLIVPFTFALLITVLWTFFYRYEYVGDNIFLFNRINIFPLILWTVGLTGLHLAHTWTKKPSSPLLAILLYLCILAAIEAIGYHILNIRLVGNHASLLGLGIIHGPVPMKLFYILAGPAYVLITHFYLNHRPVALLDKR